MPELKRALGGVMPKAGQEAGQEYARGFTQTAVSGVERASSQIATARRKEADAAGSVRVAEAKLQDLRESGKAKAAQLVAAEEGLAKAKRNLSSQTDAVTRATRDLGSAQQQASRGVHQLDDGLTKAEKSSGLLSRSVGGLGTSLKSGFGFLLGGGIVAGLGELFQAADESAKIGRLTENVIRSTGGAAQVSAKQVGDLAQAISNKTGVDDEAIQSGENLLLTFTNVRDEAGKGNDVFTQGTALVNDMSTALGTDLNSAALQVGKALNDPIKGITALQRAGVSFTAAQKSQITTLVESGRTLDAQKIILAELTKEFGGAAAAAATPWDKLKVSAGNLAEEVGGYLIPAVSAASGWIMSDLIPAAREGATWMGDEFGPAIHVAGDALGFVVDVGQGALGFFTSLPGPIQLGVLAATGWAIAGGKILDVIRPMSSSLGPLRGGWQAFGEALGYARQNGDGLGTVIRSVGSYAGGEALRGVKALARALGPELLVGGGVLVISQVVEGFQLLAGASDEAKAAAEGLARALTLTDRATDRHAVRQAIEDTEGLVEIMDKAGISSEDAINGLLGQAAAQERVTKAIQDYINLHPGGAHSDEATSALVAKNAYEELATGYGTAASNARFFADHAGSAAAAAQQTGAAAAETVPQIDEAAQALQEWQGQLQQIGASFVEPLSVYKGLLDEKTQAERDAAEKTATATKDGSDSWRNYVGDVSVSLGEYATKLQEQIINQENWRTNLVTVSQRAGYDVAAQLAQMGADGVQLTAQMANGTDAEMQRMADLLRRDAELGGAGAAAALDQQMKVMAAIGAAGAGATAAGIATALGLGVDQVAKIAAQYGITLASGINPLLVAVGKGRIPTLNGQRVPDFWDGGYTGDGGKYEPAGAVHRGEYVFTKERTARLGVRTLENVEKILPGYANGGFVTAADVPGPASTAPYRTPISTAGDAAMDTEYRATTDFVRENGPFGRALAWARSQVGKPYVWGSAGPTGYDCSGFMSAITNVIRGKSPYSRLGSTASFPWAGFGPGGGLFTIGSTKNAGGGIGHMAGTLLGTNVESRGGQGVVVGGSARGANSGLFDTRASLRFHSGGRVPDIGLPEVPAWLLPDERVLTPPEDRHFQRLLRDATARERRSPVDGASRTVQLYTPDIPHAIRALRAEEQQQDALAPVW